MSKRPADYLDRQMPDPVVEPMASRKPPKPRKAGKRKGKGKPKQAPPPPVKAR